MRPVTEETHEAVIGCIDRIVAAAEEAKVFFIRKQYENAAAELDEIHAARKKAEALINEMWE